jgi:hypothetical protein
VNADPGIERLADAMRWVEQHFEQFDPTPGSSVDLALAGGKAFMELSVATLMYARYAARPDEDLLLRFATFLCDVRARPHFRDRVLRSPTEWVLHADLNSVLTELGHPDAKVSHSLQRAVDAGFLEHQERVPHRMMDIGLSLQWAGIDANWPDQDSLRAGSILGSLPSDLYLDLQTWYALTHVIIFQTDYGCHPPSVIQPAGLSDLLATLMILSAQERDWDILGEFLLCWDCLGLEQHAITAAGWRLFLAAQQQDGSFLGPESRRSAEREKSCEEQVFRARYHTTIVAVIALSLRQARRLHPPPQPRTDHRSERGGLHARAIQGVQRARLMFERLSASMLEAEEPSLLTCCQLRFGTWLCAAVLDDGPSVMLDDELRAREDELPLVLLQAPAVAMVVCALLNLRSPLELAVAHLDSKAALEHELLLHSLGLVPPPGSRTVAAHARLIPVGLDVTPDAFAASVADLTACGTSDDVPHDSRVALATVAGGLTAHAFRTYHLPQGARTLRALAYLEQETLVASRRAPYLDHLLLQQQEDGSIGALGPEEATMSGMESDLDPVLRLRVPVTIACLLAITEGVHDDWRLVQRVPALVDCA